MAEISDSLFSASFAGLSDVDDNNADIQIRFLHPEMFPYSDIILIDSSTGSRVALQRQVPGLWSFDGRPGACLVSASIRPVRKILYGRDRLLFLASSQIVRPEARLLVYNQNYRFIAIPPTRFAIAFAYRQNRLSVVVLPFDAAPSPNDSVLVLNTVGEIVRILPAPRDKIINMTWADDGLWTMYDSEPVKFTLCDSSFSVLGEFTLPGFIDRVYPGMTWAAGRLWVVDRYVSKILGIDPDSSLLSGSAVIRDTIASSQNLYFTRGLAWSGKQLCVASESGRLLRFNLDGDTVASLALPTRVEAMAWDGEAMWIMHQGAGEATTNATLLSRFYLQ